MRNSLISIYRRIFINFIRVFTIIESSFGVVYIVHNINSYIPDFNSDCVINASKTLIFDEYTGVIYPIIVRVFGHGTLLHVFQLLVFGSVLYFAVNVFLKDFKSVDKITLGCAVFFCPFLIQINLQTLPHAVNTSMLILLAVEAKRLCDRWEKRSISIVFLGLFFVLFVISLVARCCLATKGAYGRVGFSVAFFAFSRAVWPNTLNLEMKSMLFSEELYDTFIINLREASINSELMTTVIGPAFEAVNENAPSFFLKTAIEVFGWNKKGILLSAFRDIFLYLFPNHGVTLSYLFKLKDTLTPVNIVAFTDALPFISRLYLGIYCTAIYFLIYGSLLMLIIRKDRCNLIKKFFCFFISIFVVSVVNMFFYLPEYDYRLSGAMFVFYIVFSLSIFYKDEIITSDSTRGN